MNHKSIRQSVFRAVTVLVFASMLLSSFGMSGASVARAQAAGTDTPPAEPTSTSAVADPASTATSVGETPTPEPLDAATATEAPATSAASSPQVPTETATAESSLLLAPQLAVGAGQTRHYAKPGASGDCSSWANACDMPTALTWPSGWAGGEVWAAAGVYTPTTGTNRSISFEITVGNTGVVVYGGFVGTETMLSQRNPYLHPTVLSGDIEHDDGNTYGDYRDIAGSNSYHVVKLDYGTSATFDGVTITAGDADRGNGAGTDENQGGGIYSAGTITLVDVTFRGNWARYGGGMENAYPFYATLTNVTFRGNKANNDGGAMHNCAGSIPVVTNATFAYNLAEGNGGAIANGSSITCGATNGNPAGGIGNGSQFLNVTVTGNSAAYGDGVSNLSSSPQIIDSIFWGDGGTEFDNSSSYPTIIDSIVEGGCPSDSLGPCLNVIDADPILGSLTNNGGYTPTMALGAGSAALDAGGVNTACPPPSTDQRGITRPQGAACDIGAYEGEYFAISGTVYGLASADRPNVTLSYNDSGPRTAHPDSTGAYSFSVPRGWSGTVTPSLAGYTFAPASRSYTNVTTSQTTQDYTATALYTISGLVLNLSPADVVNVSLTYNDGGTKTVHPNSSGAYSFTVAAGWSGLVTPSLTGYSFSPPSINYAPITMNQTNQNYSATLVSPTIKGTISGLGAAYVVTVSLTYFNGGWQVVHPDSSGAYSISVPVNWTGTVTPSLGGYAFSPGDRFYNPVTANVTGQDYTAILAPYTISGNTTTGNVTLSYDLSGPQTVTSDSGGNYSFQVPVGWTGTVTPSKTGYGFSPGSRTYTNVMSDFTLQNYTAFLASFISGTTNLAGVELNYDNGGPQTKIADSSGNYVIAVPDGWSGTVTPSMPGYAFTPDHMDYSNVTVDQTGQDYAPETGDLIAVDINGTTMGTYVVPSDASVPSANYGINDGPVHTYSTNGMPFFTSERGFFEGSFSTVAGYPGNQLATDYWFTTYDDVSMIDWMVVGNPDTSNTAQVDIYIGPTKMNASPISIGPGQRYFKRYGVSGGPVHVVSTNAVPIFTSQRTKYQQSSVSEVVGFRGDLITTGYWFTTYDDLGINMELAIGNPDPSNTAQVDVYIGGSKMNTTPYSIGPRQRIGLHYGINNGPVHVVSTNGVSIFASERSIYQSNFAEATGQADAQMTTDYWFTTYDDLSMIDWLVVGNPDTTYTAQVDIYIGSTKMNASPISIAPGQRYFKRYGISGGPVHVVSTNGVKIFTSDRSKYQQASTTEILGIGGNQLTTDYWYTTYDDLGWTTNVMLAAP